MTLTNRVMEWVKRPFHSDMSVGGWLAFVALVLLSFVFWTRVLRDVMK